MFICKYLSVSGGCLRFENENLKDRQMSIPFFADLEGEETVNEE